MEKAPELTIWIHKKTGLERRLNAFTVRKLGKSLTDNYYQVEQPTRPKENPPEVQALLDAAKKVNCCDKEGCECKKDGVFDKHHLDLKHEMAYNMPEIDPKIREQFKEPTFENAVKVITENFNGDETTTAEITTEYKPALTPKNKGGRPKSKRK